MNSSRIARAVSAALLASVITACSDGHAVPPVLPTTSIAAGATRAQSLTPSNATLATYEFYCSEIGLGTITATVVANSQGDAFHVTGVDGGNGTVKPGDMLLVYAYTPADKWPSSNPGFEKNGQTTYTCPSFSGRRQIYGTVSFFVRGGLGAAETASYFYCEDIGLGTITAVVTANSKGDAFHVTQVDGGNGTVKPGDMLLAIAYTNAEVTHSNPGYEKNGLTTYTCPSYSGRRQLLGSVTFAIANGKHQ